MSSPFEEATFLGVLQGLSTFLPISGDGHLALARMLLDSQDSGLTLNVPLHMGTLLATLIYFRARIAEIARELWQQLRLGGLPSRTSAGWDAVIVTVAAAPTALLGLALRDLVAAWAEQPLVTGFGFVLTACFLTSTLWTRSGTLVSPSLAGALLLGVAQGMAVAPGLSRSGLTIVVALWLGLRGERAFELSMLMSVPAVAAALLVELLAGQPLEGPALALALGAVAALAAGLFALPLLRRVVSRSNIAWFALWVLPLALATLALAKAWPS